MGTGPQVSTGPHGVCSACGSPIAIGAINIMRPFQCLHCGQSVQAPKTMRALVYVVFYGLPTVILFHAPIPILLRIPVWFVLAFALTFIYAFVSKRLFVVRLGEFREPGEKEFQSLNLRK